MSRISREAVKHIALLSRLELSDDEAEMDSEHISEILDYVEQLQSLDVAGVEPTSHAIPLFNVMRGDSVKAHLSLEEALQNAPDKEGPFFRVPRVTE